MAIQHSDFDTLLENWYSRVYQFCFLVTTQSSAADDLTFQTFLYAGSEPAPDTKEAQSVRLFALAWKSCEDYFYRKMRKRSSRESVEKEWGFSSESSISDEEWNVLNSSPSKKAAWYLSQTADFSSQDIAQILGCSVSHAQQMTGDHSLPYPAALIEKIPPKESFDEMSDRIYLRFEQRNVGLENKLRNFRLFWDKAVIWIALAIVVLFAAAAFYTAAI